MKLKGVKYMEKIAFFLGSYIPDSTHTLFTNLTEYISDSFDIDIVGFYGEKKFGDNVNEVIYNYSSEKGFKRMYYAAKALRKYDREHNPDLIILPHMYSVYGLPFLLSVNLEKTIIRLNGDIFNQYSDCLYESKINRLKDFLFVNVLSTYILKRARGVIVQTQYMYDQCVKRGINPDKITILPLPIRTNIFKMVGSIEKKEIKRELDIKEDIELVLIVGSISKIKRRYILCEILKNCQYGDDVIFMIIGKTEYGKKLSEKYSNVIYEGYVEHDDIYKYFQAGDILIHFSHHEGLPTVFQEATACGLPIIAKKANYNQGMDICKYDTIKELSDMIKKKVWKEMNTYVTPGLTKKEYIEYFNNAIKNEVSTKGE